MSATHDNSVLFSLNQLMALHETRIQEEEAESLRKAEDEKKAREEALRQAEELAAQKAREEAEKMALRQAAERREQARLEALQLAEIERARVEAETQARLQMQAQANEHERALEAMREDEKKKKLKRAIWTGSLCGAAALIGIMGLYFGKIKPANDALIVQQAAEINAQMEDTRRYEAQLEANRKKIAQAESLLADAKRTADAEREAAAAAKPQTPKPWLGVAKTQPKTTTKTSACLPGEPGCDLNGNRIF